MTLFAYVLGFLAAMSNGAANVAQRAASRQEPPELQFSLRLILHLARRPVWVAGIGAVVLSFILQAIGLGLGSLTGVEPLLVLELPLTLMGARWLLGEHIGRQGWSAIALMTGSTVCLIAALGPSGGSPRGVSWEEWIMAIGLTAAAAAILFLAARATSNLARRAALLGTATGITFGLAASLVKGTTARFSEGGLAAVFSSWELYLAFAVGFFAMWLLQSAMNAGRLVVAQPGMTLADPFVSIIWGTAVFGESVRSGGYLVLAVAAGVVLTLATVALARSPALVDTRAKPEQREADRPPARN